MKNYTKNCKSITKTCL